MANHLLFIVCSFLGVSKVHSETSKIDLYIGGFFGVNIKDGAWSSAALIPALEMALDHVNNDSTILTNYSLKYHWRDSKCESGAGIRAMLELIDTPPHKIVFLGPGCSVATRPVAEAAPYWEVVQIGYSTTSPLFSDKEKFPLYFRTTTSETMENPSRVALLNYFKWKKVALIVQSLDIYVLTKEELVPKLEESNITIIASESFKNDPSISIKYLLKEKDARIIIGLMYEGMFRKAMCTAYKEGVHGNKLVWIIVGWYNDDWWTKQDVDCNGEQLLKAAANVIETLPLPLSTSSEPIISRRTAGELKAEYFTRIRHLNQTYNTFAAFMYDAAWSIALMLNKSISFLQKVNKTLETITYRDAVAAKIMNKILRLTDFAGMSGHVTFDKLGNRQTVVQLSQNIRGRRKVVAMHDARDGKLRLTDNDSFEWQGGRVPVDGVTTIQKLFQDDQHTVIAFYVLASIGITFCFYCLLFNYVYRKHRMSSPKFNNVIVVGCMLCYVEVFMSSYKNSISATHNASLCYIRAWLLSTGFTLAFGGIFVKTWRVFKIFTNNQMKRQIGKLSDKNLLLKLAFGWFIDVVILSIWAATDPMRVEITMIPTEADDNHDDVVEELLVYQCTSNKHASWVLSICGSKGILLIFGVFLAWETRNVHYPALNDSKNIGLAVYNVFMFSCLAMVTEFLVTYLPLGMLVGRTLVFVGTTSTICLLFVPKIIHLRKSNHVNSFTNPSQSEFQTSARTNDNSSMAIETYKTSNSPT